MGFGVGSIPALPMRCGHRASALRPGFVKRGMASPKPQDWCACESSICDCEHHKHPACVCGGGMQQVLHKGVLLII